MYSFGIYIGASLSNITIIIIESIGWRATYFMVGCLGIAIAVLGIVVMREPGRGVFEPKKINEVEDEREEDELVLDSKEVK